MGKKSKSIKLEEKLFKTIPAYDDSNDVDMNKVVPNKDKLFCEEVKSSDGILDDWFESLTEDDFIGLDSYLENPIIPKKDLIVEAVVKEIRRRSSVGISKYGVTLERNDLKPSEWLKHLQEELMDGTNYIQKLLEEQKKIERLIELTPNDSDLGELVRNIYSKMK